MFKKKVSNKCSVDKGVSEVVTLTCLILSEAGLRYPGGMELRWSVTASAGDTLLTSVYSD